MSIMARIHLWMNNAYKLFIDIGSSLLIVVNYRWPWSTSVKKPFRGGADWLVKNGDRTTLGVSSQACLSSNNQRNRLLRYLLCCCCSSVVAVVAVVLAFFGARILHFHREPWTSIRICLVNGIHDGEWSRLMDSQPFKFHQNASSKGAECRLAMATYHSPFRQSPRSPRHQPCATFLRQMRQEQQLQVEGNQKDLRSGSESEGCWRCRWKLWWNLWWMVSSWSTKVNWWLFGSNYGETMWNLWWTGG